MPHLSGEKITHSCFTALIPCNCVTLYWRERVLPFAGAEGTEGPAAVVAAPKRRLVGLGDMAEAVSSLQGGEQPHTLSAPAAYLKPTGSRCLRAGIALVTILDSVHLHRADGVRPSCAHHGVGRDDVTTMRDTLPSQARKSVKQQV